MAFTLVLPSVAGYGTEQSADLQSAEQQARLSGSALKAFVAIADRWGLTEAQARGLLGGVASSTFHAWKTYPDGRRLDQDTLTRISLVMGIYKALHSYFGKAWADRWVTLENRGPLFGGRTPLDTMLRQGQPGMVEVRRMLDAWRGGH